MGKGATCQVRKECSYSKYTEQRETTIEKNFFSFVRILKTLQMLWSRLPDECSGFFSGPDVYNLHWKISSQTEEKYWRQVSMHWFNKEVTDTKPSVPTGWPLLTPVCTPEIAFVRNRNTHPWALHIYMDASHPQSYQASIKLWLDGMVSRQGKWSCNVTSQTTQLALSYCHVQNK